MMLAPVAKGYKIPVAQISLPVIGCFGSIQGIVSFGFD